MRNLKRYYVNNAVVIIKGNPEKMKGWEKEADAYYEEIREFIEKLGFKVTFDPGEPKTCPPLDVAFWVAHSRGVDRERCVNDKDKWRFVKFGSLDGIIHPKDASWQKGIVNHLTTKEQPPKEHFIFTEEQKQAIRDTVKRI